jgi:hypothetical protein
MCEGVCSRCREKVQWRFRYDKYKPLRAPATCQECRAKTITKAYRTLCDKCSKKKGACASCCISFEEDAERRATTAAAVDGVAEEGIIAASTPAQSSQPVVGKVSSIADADMDLESDREDDGDDAAQGDEEGSNGGPAEDAAMESAEPAMKQGIELANGWDERKFQNIAALKYGKHRVVGTEEDTVFNFTQNT